MTNLTVTLTLTDDQAHAILCALSDKRRYCEEQVERDVLNISSDFWGTRGAEAKDAYDAILQAYYDRGAASVRGGA